MEEEETRQKEKEKKRSPGGAVLLARHIPPATHLIGTGRGPTLLRTDLGENRLEGNPPRVLGIRVRIRFFSLGFWGAALQAGSNLVPTWILGEEDVPFWDLFGGRSGGPFLCECA